jgi:enolase
MGDGGGDVSATTISGVLGRRVWDSRGRPTVEAEIRLAGGTTGRAIAPAGASTGSGEARDLRDGGERFGGLDVTRAVAAVNDVIAPALAGTDAADQAAVDGILCELDGTPDKRRLGGNATIAVSMAAAHASAAAAGLPLWRHLGGDEAVTLPLPEIQIFGGGAHAAGRLDVQDFLVVCPGAATFAESLDWTADVYRAAGTLMAAAGRLKGVADEGGFWPDFDSNEQALEMLTRAIERAGFRPVEQVAIALDIAATQLGNAGRYRLARDGRELDTDGLIEVIEGWLGRYPSSRSRIRWPRTTRKASSASRGATATASRWWATTSSSPTRAACAPRRRPAPARPCWSSRTSAGRSPRPAALGRPPAPTAWAASPRPARARARTSRSSTSRRVGRARAEGGLVHPLGRMAKWNEGLRIEEALGSRARVRGARGAGAAAGEAGGGVGAGLTGAICGLCARCRSAISESSRDYLAWAPCREPAITLRAALVTLSVPLPEPVRPDALDEALRRPRPDRRGRRGGFPDRDPGRDLATTGCSPAARASPSWLPAAAFYGIDDPERRRWFEEMAGGDELATAA